MIPESFLVTVALAEGALLLAIWLLILGHGAVASVRDRRRHRRETPRRILVRGLLDRTLTDADRARLARLGPGEAAELFAEFAPHLRGAEREWLGSVALDMGLVNRARRLCGSRLWWNRLAGARTLTLVGGEPEAVLALAKDGNPLIRAQVAEWLGAYASEQGARALAGMLGDRNQVSRFSVQDALVRLGGLAVEPLNQRLRGVRDPIAAVAGLRVAAGLGDPRLIEPALALSRDGDPAVRVAAYHALGAMGGEAGGGRLIEALEDPVPRARAAAATALGRMGHWQASVALGSQLDHSSWDVRLAAARALAALGAPGELTLKRLLSAPNTFVADMARHALDRARVEGGRSTTA